MKSTDAPSKQAVPFGTNGPREAITPTTPSGSNQASYDQGFPPITMTLKSAGGLPPKGQDMNQILFEMASFSRFFSAGGGYPFDESFSSLISGYPKGAIVPSSDSSGYWLNTNEDNQINPENNTSAITGWIPIDGFGVTNVSGLSASSVTLSTLQASKDLITLSGTLTANVNIIVPAWQKSWSVINNTAGSFSVTIKTPSGTGVSLAQGLNVVYGDGTNIYDQYSSFILPLNRGGTGATTASAARTNLGLGAAATRDVGTGSTQIPDMSAFSSQSGSIGYSRLPNGMILQYGFANTSSGGVATITMPIMFSTSNYRVVGSAVDQAVPNIVSTASNTANTFSASAWGANNSSLLGVRQGTSFNWVAMGF